jgi:hypothetical protein
MIQPWPEFAALLGLHGDAHALQRDRVLADKAGLALHMPALLVDPDWRRRVHAAILQGWIDHAALYRQVLHELDQVDPAREHRTLLGMPRVWNRYADQARDDYKQAILPLCWEVLLKFGDLWPAWKVMTFLRMIGAVPHADSVEVILVYMQDVAPIDGLENAALTLRDLARVGSVPAVTARVAALEAKLAAQPQAPDPRTAALLHAWRGVLRDAADGFLP